MTPNEALDYFGTKKDMALALEVTNTTVYSFFSKGRISKQCQIKIEEITEGQLKISLEKDQKTGKYIDSPGRPREIEIAVQASLALSKSDYAAVTSLGFGNRSLGMRKLLDALGQKISHPEATTNEE